MCNPHKEFRVYPCTLVVWSRSACCARRAHLERALSQGEQGVAERGGEGEDTKLYGQRVCREDAPFTCVCLPRVRCPRYVPTASRVRARAAESTKIMMNERGIEQPGVAKETEITDYRHVDPLLGREGDVMDTTRLARGRHRASQWE